MATVISLTEQKIKELLAGWEGVALSQDEINALVLQLQTNVESQGASLTNFNEVVRPQLEADLAAGSIKISELNDTTIPNLQAELAQAQDEVQDLVTITVPALQQEMANTSTNVNERPNVYVQPEAPTNPDVDDRDLVVGDSWFDSDDGNKQRVWNGVEWSTFNVDVADFSLTVRKFLSSTHQIY